MKKSKFIVLIVINILLIGIVVWLSITNFKNRSANDIYSDNINSIVEVKATTEDVGESFGTGVIYDSQGYLITNAHVISYKSLGENILFETYEIRFPLLENYQSATFVKVDYELDLAILKINDESIKYNPIEFSGSDSDFGDIVYAIGNTSNYGIGISQGIISVPEVNVKYDDISRLVIQADINIASGNSGGALLNKKGKLIGITTFRTKDLLGNVNYGFTYSIPLKVVKEFIKEK